MTTFLQNALNMANSLLAEAVLVAFVGTVAGYLTARHQIRAERERRLQESKDSFSNRRRDVYEEFLWHLDTYPGEAQEDRREWERKYREAYVRLVSVSGRHVFDEWALGSDFGDPKPLGKLAERKALLRAMHKDLFPREYGVLSWTRRRL